MPIVRTPTATLYYESHGEGTPVVFVSGWGMSHTCWSPVVELMRDRFRCIVFDTRGTGRSRVVDGAPYEIQDLIDDLQALCEHAAAFDAHLVGHELGGRVATLAARLHPQLVTTLTITGWWGAAEINEALGDFARFRQTASLLLHDLGSYPIVRNLVAWGYRRAPEPMRSELFEEFGELDAQAAYQTAAGADDPAACAAFDDAVSRLTLPVLLVQGSDDREAARRGLRGLFRRFGHVDLATVHGSGPLPMVEHPGPFARTLAQFFTEHAPK